MEEVRRSTYTAAMVMGMVSDEALTGFSHSGELSPGWQEPRASRRAGSWRKKEPDSLMASRGATENDSAMRVGILGPGTP